MLSKEGHLLRVYISESDRHKGKPLSEWIVQEARSKGLAGCTVLRGLEGFGASAHMHTTRILRLSENLPLVIEIVDTLEKIEDFLPLIDEAVSDGLVTVEKVQIRIHRGGNE